MLIKMKYLRWFMTILFVMVIVACTQQASETPTIEPGPISPTSVSGGISPGDRIGEMAFTKAGEWNWDNNLYTACQSIGEVVEVEESVFEIRCEVFAGSQMILNCSGVGKTSEEVNEKWPRLKTVMVFDDRQIDLASFGSLDFQGPDGNHRIWNVLLNNISPGAHTLYCESQIEGLFHNQRTYHFTVKAPEVIELPPNADELQFYGQSDHFSTLAEFYNLLQQGVGNDQLAAIWDPVKATGKMPLIFGDYVAFLYRGEASSVHWKGLYFTKAYSQMGKTDLWMMLQQFEPDATIDYKIAVDGEEILDPLNPITQEGFFPISVLRMPEFVYPEETLYREDIPHGDLTENILISSEQLGYDKHYRVYTPPGYETLESLPVIYVTDGTDAINEVYLGMVNVLDNLIADGRIQPIMAVFIAPHNANTGEYVREVELSPTDLNTCPFCDFVAETLVPQIDANYKTNPSPDARAILGTSLGGQWASYMGLLHHDLFHLISIQCHPTEENHWLIEAYQNVEQLPITVFLHHGTYDFGTAPRLAEILEQKGVPVLYIETHGGHSHGSWRGTTDELLVYFFGPR